MIDEYIYGFHHPYGKYTSTLDYDQLNRDELITYFKRFYVEGHCTIFTAGKIPADLQEQLNKYFGGLPLQNRPIPNIQYNLQPAIEKKQQIINDENGVQGAIRIARAFPNKHHPDYQKAQILNSVFGGFFGSRLMSNIREDKGYTYGIHSYLQNHMQECAWMISTDAGKDVCRATIDEVYKEMKILREELVEQDELDLVKNHMLGSLLGDLDGPLQIIGRWKTYILNGLTEDYFYNTIQTVRTIELKTLQDLANKYLKEEDFYELVVY